MNFGFWWTVARITAVAVAADALDLGVGEDVDVGVVDGRSHLRRGDAARTVERGKDLAEQDHLAAHAGLLLDDEHLVAHVAQLERGLHAADAAAHHESVVLHGVALREGPSSVRDLEYSCM